MPIEIGNMFNEYKLKKFLNKLSLNFEIKFTYEIIPCSQDNKIIVKIIEAENDKKYENIISFD